MRRDLPLKRKITPAHWANPSLFAKIGNRNQKPDEIATSVITWINTQNTKMKLILINGPTGVGKSTIAQKIHQGLPLSFLLDIDAQRRYISGYREHRGESLDLVIKLSLAMVENYLQSKHDVVIDKVLTDVEVAERFLELGRKYNATVFEFVLNVDKETLMARAEERGYKEGGMLTPEKVPEFWERIQNYIKEKPQAIIVNTKNLNIEETFEYIQGKILQPETINYER